MRDCSTLLGENAQYVSEKIPVYTYHKQRWQWLLLTSCEPGRSSVVADSAGRRIVDLASLTWQGSSPSARCSRDNALLHRSLEGICQFTSKHPIHMQLWIKRHCLVSCTADSKGLNFPCVKWEFLRQMGTAENFGTFCLKIAHCSMHCGTFLSASLYVSKRGAYWDRLCRDVVGHWLSRACTVAKRCILGL